MKWNGLICMEPRDFFFFFHVLMCSFALTFQVRAVEEINAHTICLITLQLKDQPFSSIEFAQMSLKLLIRIQSSQQNKKHCDLK